MPCSRREAALAGFDGDVLILYGDVPFVRADDDGARCSTGCTRADAPAVVVLGFRPADARAYGRIIADADGGSPRWSSIRTRATRSAPIDLCNSGLMAVRAADLWPLLARVGNDNAAGEYYLPDIVMLAAADGRALGGDRGRAVARSPGVNSRAELAAVEARLAAAPPRRRRWPTAPR